jgi:single-stranded-DNA-specific exonuclease
LEGLLQTITVSKIYACYRVEESTFLKAWPSRDHFKWFYGMLLKRKEFNLHREGDQLAKRKGWDRSMVDFISQVFFELEFVKIKDGLITINSQPSKKDLKESTLYQEKEKQLMIEKTLYYSTYKELKNWFNQYLNVNVKPVKEEVVNGL